MQIDLTLNDLDILIESLQYSARNISDAHGTPYDVRSQNLLNVNQVAAKIREARLILKNQQPS